MTIGIVVPDELPGTPESYAICRCGHPMVDHYIEHGCQAAVSHRPESMGGGLGSSRCECTLAEARGVCVIPARYVTRFRCSPLREHALIGGIRSVKSADGQAGQDEIEFDFEQMGCVSARFGGCSEDGTLPYYGQGSNGPPDGTSTVFVCEGHAARLRSHGVIFDRIPKHVSVKKRKERIAKHREMLNDEAYQKAHGLESMGLHPDINTVEELRARIRSQRKQREQRLAEEGATE